MWSLLFHWPAPLTVQDFLISTIQFKWKFVFLLRRYSVRSNTKLDAVHELFCVFTVLQPIQGRWSQGPSFWMPACHCEWLLGLLVLLPHNIKAWRRRYWHCRKMVRGTIAALRYHFSAVSIPLPLWLYGTFYYRNTTSTAVLRHGTCPLLTYSNEHFVRLHCISTEIATFGLSSVVHC